MDNRVDTSFDFEEAVNQNRFNSQLKIVITRAVWKGIITKDGAKALLNEV